MELYRIFKVLCLISWSTRIVDSYHWGIIFVNIMTVGLRRKLCRERKWNQNVINMRIFAQFGMALASVIVSKFDDKNWYFRHLLKLIIKCLFWSYELLMVTVINCDYGFDWGAIWVSFA